ncbi:hypothetical protein RCS94_03650 [Orbaceae bacterium ac157xtp]
MSKVQIKSILDLCETVIEQDISVITINGKDLSLTKDQQSGFRTAFIVIKSFIENTPNYKTENIDLNGDDDD